MPTCDARLEMLIMLVHLLHLDIKLLKCLLEIRLAQELKHVDRIGVVVRPRATPGLRRRRAHGQERD